MSIKFTHNNFPIPLKQQHNLTTLIDSGTILKDSNTTKAAIIELNGIKVFAKRYNNKGLRFTLRYIFRAARAFRAYNMGLLLIQNNIPTPTPLLAFSKKTCAILNYAILVTEQIQGTIATNDIVELLKSNTSLRNTTFNDIFKNLSILHKLNIVHGDFKITNIYFTKTKENSIKTGFWDLDSLKKMPTVPKHKIAQDLGRFAFSFVSKSKADIKDQIITEIIDVYLQHNSTLPYKKEELKDAVIEFYNAKERRKHGK